MNKSNLVGLGVMAAASVAVIALANPAYDAIKGKRMENAAGGQETTVVKGEAEGYGGPITAEVTMAGGKIIGLELTGESETPEIGGTAMNTLKEAILAAQGLDGVDAVSGATWTSNGVFDAVKSAMGSASGSQETTVASGEAEGYGGPITAQVTLAGGKIVGLELTGESETPEIGGAAMNTLKEAILAAGGLDGVDAVSGATWTSNGVFEAVKAAAGTVSGSEETAAEETEAAQEVQASGISHGMGFYSNGRLGPGKDDQDVGVYSINEVVAYVLFDNDGKILDLEVDQLEVATPNYDGEHMPKLTGFPGHSYNADEDHDEKVDTVLEQTEDSFLAQIESWKTKRERGSTYKLGAGTWEDEMNLFEEKFKGMTTDEVDAWFAAYCSDLNGRPLHGTSDKEEDVKKYEALTDAERADLDAISGATMSLRDPHGDILGAIANSWKNAKDANISVTK